MPNESCQCGHLDLSHVLENGPCSTLVGMSRLWCACTGFKATPKPLGKSKLWTSNHGGEGSR